MANLDQSLDDIIKSDERRSTRGTSGRAPGGGGVRRGGRPPRSAPYARPSKRSGGDETMSGNELKVNAQTVPNKLAGMICNTVRESPNNIPGVLATGPGAINQAIKGIAIARKYLLEDKTVPDIIVRPVFEKDLRSGSNVTLELTKMNRKVNRQPSEDDLSAKDKTDCFKLAGAIAGRIRDGEDVAVTTKGPIPVLVAVKAIALAQEYLNDDGVELKFTVQLVDLEDPELRGNPASTYLHFALLK